MTYYEKLKQFNEISDRLNRLRIQYKTTIDWDIKQMILDEIYNLTFRLKKLEKELSQDIEKDDYTMALDMLKGIEI